MHYFDKNDDRICYPLEDVRAALRGCLCRIAYVINGDAEAVTQKIVKIFSDECGLTPDHIKDFLECDQTKPRPEMLALLGFGVEQRCYERFVRLPDDSYAPPSILQQRQRFTYQRQASYDTQPAQKSSPEPEQISTTPPPGPQSD